MAKSKKAMTAKQWASVKFKGEGPEAQRALGSLQDWMRRAENEYPTIFFATSVIQHDDEHAFALVKNVGPEVAIEFAEALKRFVDAHRAIAQIANAAELRVIAAMSRFERLEAETDKA